MRLNLQDYCVFVGGEHSCGWHSRGITWGTDHAVWAVGALTVRWSWDGNSTAACRLSSLPRVHPLSGANTVHVEERRRENGKGALTLKMQSRFTYLLQLKLATKQLPWLTDHNWTHTSDVTVAQIVGFFCRCTREYRLRRCFPWTDACWDSGLTAALWPALSLPSWLF